MEKLRIESEIEAVSAQLTFEESKLAAFSHRF
jgi:hypothetical protein